MLLLRSEDGVYLISMAEAVKQVKAERRRRRRPERDTQTDEFLCGAPRKVSAAERDDVLPPWEGQGELSGIPYLLYSDPSLHDEGWPTARFLPDGMFKKALVTRQLGLHAAGIDGLPHVAIELQKFVRAILPVGDAVSCVQCKTQYRKDNSWCFVEYITADGGSLQYVGHLDFFLKAEYTTADGFNLAPACRRPAQPLRLAVLRLYECECDVFTPGLRHADPELGRPPEFIRIPNTAAQGEPPHYECAGQWVITLETLTSQLVPTRERPEGRYFMWANKASGRTAPVKMI